MTDTTEDYPIAEIKTVLQASGLLAPERGIDDELDSETWTALYLFAESRGIAWSLDDFEAEDGLVPEAVIAALLDPMARLSFAAEADDIVAVDEADTGPCDPSEVEVFDLREMHEFNPKKAKRITRKVESITTIVLHQTGCRFGVGKRALAKYGQREALHRRFFDVACHVAALRNGDVLLVNPWQLYVLHGHASNRCSIGVEIEGRYAGVVGDPKTVAPGVTADLLTAQTIAAARKAVAVSVEQCRALGCPLTKIAAHRNYHGSRVCDPGEEIWREVALWAVANLGLTVDYELASRSKDNSPSKNGRTIPREWDPSAKFDFRGRPVS